MIVDPDFFDHWRTRMVIDMLGGDPLAPVYIMRLWAHCQNRKADTFAIPTVGIKALCQFNGDAQALEEALIAAEYMSRDGSSVTVIGWAEKNAQLLAAWSNGSKGGRPSKKATQEAPTGNQPEAKTEPNDTPEETHGKPNGNPTPTGSKAIRVDKRREEETPPNPPVGGEDGFSEFWECWPKNERKQDKAKCLDKWRRFELSAEKASILADVEAKKLTRKWLEGFVEMPLTYLNNKRWQDGGAGDQADENKPEWAINAGFSNRWEAENEGCYERNAHLFSNGKRTEVAA